MTSTPRSRFLLRLHAASLRCYEVFLFAAIVAMALVVALPAEPLAAGDDSVQCGNIQSSADVISR
ncbi:MAG TPA: hypothetical protein VHL79_12990 [Ramlibacter sp.]|jgi:hypothetical protein|nr:hypothetical protein [Ramlibacter sp.]